jgi:hypothetical protein
MASNMVLEEQGDIPEQGEFQMAPTNNACDTISLENHKTITISLENHSGPNGDGTIPTVFVKVKSATKMDRVFTEYCESHSIQKDHCVFMDESGTRFTGNDTPHSLGLSEGSSIIVHHCWTHMTTTVVGDFTFTNFTVPLPPSAVDFQKTTQEEDKQLAAVFRKAGIPEDDLPRYLEAAKNNVGMSFAIPAECAPTLPVNPKDFFKRPPLKSAQRAMMRKELLQQGAKEADLPGLLKNMEEMFYNMLENNMNGESSVSNTCQNDMKEMEMARGVALHALD